MESGASSESPWKPRTMAAAMRAGQVRIFAQPFGDAAPARVARDVQHRSEGPVDARGGGLARRDARRLPDQIRDPSWRPGPAGSGTWCGSRGSRPAPKIRGIPRRLSFSAMRCASALSAGVPPP